MRLIQTITVFHPALWPIRTTHSVMRHPKQISLNATWLIQTTKVHHRLVAILHNKLTLPCGVRRVNRGSCCLLRNAVHHNVAARKALDQGHSPKVLTNEKGSMSMGPMSTKQRLQQYSEGDLK